MTNEDKGKDGVPDDADMDLPFPDEGDEGKDAHPVDTPGIENIDPEKRHSWWVENFKNVAALGIVAVSLIAVCVLAMARAVMGDAEGLSSATGVFSSVATTALGYLFGRNSR